MGRLQRIGLKNVGQVKCKLHKNMKESPIPTQDLKTSVKILGVFSSRTFEAIKPTLKREAGRRTLKLLESLKRNKI